MSQCVTYDVMNGADYKVRIMVNTYQVCLLYLLFYHVFNTELNVVNNIYVIAYSVLILANQLAYINLFID